MLNKYRRVKTIMIVNIHSIKKRSESERYPEREIIFLEF